MPEIEKSARNCLEVYGFPVGFRQMMNDFRSKTGQKAFFSSLLSVWSDQYSRAARVAAIARDGAKLTALMIIRLIVPGPNVATEQPAPG